MPAELPHLSSKQQLIGFGILKKKYELWPLLACLSFGCVLATAFSAYAVYQKPDVRLNRKGKVSPPWEEVNPEQSQKLLTINAKYQKNLELEKLRKEIGSYKY